MGQIQGPEQVPEPAVATIHGPPPGRKLLWEPATPEPGLQTQRAELINTDLPIDRGLIIQLQDDLHFLAKIGIAGPDFHNISALIRGRISSEFVTIQVLGVVA